MICPYCGHTSETEGATRCAKCHGLFEPKSRIATQLAMGAWFVRNPDQPFMPGFNLDVMRQQVASGRVGLDTPVRGPTTNQFWMRAAEVPGISRLLGKCHACGEEVPTDGRTCHACGADMSLPKTIDALGLMYVSPSERDAAERELAENTPVNKKTIQGEPIMVDPSMMIPVEDEPERNQHEDHEEAHNAFEIFDEPYEEHGDHAEEHHEPLTVELAHQVSETTSRRRHQNGPNTMIVSLSILLMCTVAIGALILISQGGPTDAGAADNDATAQEDTTLEIERSLEEVALVGLPVQDDYAMIADQGVPESLAAELLAVKATLDKAGQQQSRGELSRAYDTYKTAQSQLGVLELSLHQWEKQQSLRADLERERGEAVAMRDQAAAADAAKWAPALWADANNTLKQADAQLAAGALDDAFDAIHEAERGYQDAFRKANDAAEAQQAQQTMLAAMKAGNSEKTIRAVASPLLNKFNALRQEGNELFQSGVYRDATRRYNDATEALARANQAVEQARYAKFYACDAGVQAAKMMVHIASGDKVDSAQLTALTTAYDQLGLATNPADKLKAGEATAYGPASTALVHEARKLIGEAMGEQAQACYYAGFHIQIVNQTLTSLSLTDTQKKRVHQSLSTIEKQAQAAGWSMPRLRRAIEAVRVKNRTATRGDDPKKTREVWSKMMQTLSNRDKASRLMDPEHFGPAPNAPDDPDLFPGLGSNTRY